ncbi:MAG: DUF1080 domain-containing protein [Cytophagales bacterium]|nr:MAG: DUF1080 domain-containing protein [Cytophagales bacterium]
MKPTLLLLGIIAFFSFQKPARSLFDGKTFAGWEGDTGTIWRVENGALVGGSLTTFVPHNYFLSTRQSYGNFVLRLKMKLEGTGFVNAGIQFRSQRAEKPDYEMIGYQADMGGNYWGCLYDESRRNKVLTGPDSTTIRRIVKPNDWNQYEIRCEGPRIRLYLNNTLTIDYTEPDAIIPRTGLIALQIHGGGKAQVQYKEIMLEEL